MSSIEQIGELSVVHKEIDIEWKIFNFFSLSKVDSKYRSAHFHALNSRWHLEIYPNGNTTQSSTGYFSFFLSRDDSGPPKIVEFELGMKTVDNLVKNKLKFSWTFEERSGRGWPKFMKRSDLQQQMSELVPSNTLTLTCSMKVKDADTDTNEISGLDKLSADLMDMFISKRNSDVTIKLKDEIFSVHKTILAARSPVFAAMFENEMSEKNTGFINIADCDPETFNDFLFYLYSGKVKNIAECDIFHLYVIADKYSVQDLKSTCVSFMMENLSVANVCESVVLGYHYSETNLMTKVQSFFNENFNKIVSTDAWVALLEQNCHLANQLLKAMAPKVKIGK